MAIVSVVREAGEESLYDIPDSELGKYELKSAPLTDEDIARLFPGKEKPTKEDAHGVTQVAPHVDGDVEAYQAICRYWYIDSWGTYWWWYDWC